LVARFALTITGVLLAAGLSRRMGKPKLLVRLSGRPILAMTLEAFQSSQLDNLLVVANAATADFLRSESKDARTRIILNPRPEAGLATSLKLAVSSLDSEAVVIGLGDQPLLFPSTIDALISEHERSGASIVVPVRHGHHGNPVLFGRIHFPEIMSVEGDVGARQVIVSHHDAVREVEVDDEGILMDIDTPADLANANELLARREELATQTRTPGAGARSLRSPQEERPSPREPRRTHSLE